MTSVSTPALEELCLRQKQYLLHYFEALDLSEVEAVLEVCLQCSGILALTGLGKSGIIAQKIARTFVSTGTRSLFLPPTDLLHGDIGVLTEDDVVLLFSKSGETKELIEMVGPIRMRGAKIIAVVSDRDSRLAKEGDLMVTLPVEKELCPFDLAPTTSATVQLLFGDLLSISLMQKKGFRLEDYAQNHPSGSIGKKITLTVRELMKNRKELPICRPEDRLMDALFDLSDKKCGCLLVAREDKLLGIFTDGDLRRALHGRGGEVVHETMDNLLTAHPIVVGPEELALDAMKKMQENRFVMVAPVIENGKLIGLIRLHDIIHEGI
ncbi:MAG: Arabinose 5-phosphate isomerase KdsD [Chlamydiae bacterium]|nr:Arabinose 5-phosphate isomerase KdsD [Chlamydiota bacterium]